MVQRKRISACKPPSDYEFSEQTGEKSTMSSEPIIPFLTEVTAGCTVFDADPFSCIPLYLVRQSNRNTIEILKSILDGRCRSPKFMLSGAVCASPSSIIVPLQGELEILLDKQLELICDTKEDVTIMKHKHTLWFGIIDGCQYHTAVTELMRDVPSKWGSYRWKVILVHGNSSREQYRQLARVQNERSKQIYNFECTVYDLHRGLRVEFDIVLERAVKKSRTGERGAKYTHREVAEQYDGGDHSSPTSIKQAVSVASRISWRTLDAIGEVVNQECADVIVHRADFNTFSLSSKQEVLAHQDCRLFKSFVCFGAFRSSKSFMSACSNGLEDAQVKTIYRMRHWSELHNYKPVQGKVITQLFDLAVSAIQEEEKFLRFIKEQEWPPNMETTKENLLRGTLCDKEIQLNRGNDTDVLDTIWKCFKRLYPARAKAIEEDVHSASNESSDGESTEDSGESSNLSKEDPPVPPDDSGSNPDSENDNEQERSREKERRERDRIIQLQSNADAILSNLGVHCYNMSFIDFSKEVWTGDSPRMDLVFSTLPINCEESTLKDIPQFCKMVLHMGSYCFFIVTETQFATLSREFEKASFKVFNHSFQILYDLNTIQRRTNTDFPQRHGDIAIIAKTSGEHPSKYKPSFVIEDGGDQRRFASLTGVEACMDRLKKPSENVPIVIGEKSVSLYSHIIRMLCPPSGAVMDIIAGAFTTALSSLETGRKCICIEKNEISFKYALGRLRVHAVPGATMVDLADHSQTFEESTHETLTRAPEENIISAASPKRRRLATNDSDAGNALSVDQVCEPQPRDLQTAEPEAAKALLMFNDPL